MIRGMYVTTWSCFAHYAGTKATLQPCLLDSPTRITAVYGNSSLAYIRWNRFKILNNAKAHSVSTMTCAGQIRGPPPKGAKLHIGRVVSHRSGRNSSASAPQIPGSRCMRYRLQWMVSPLAIKMGNLPLVPPPAGRTVSRMQYRTVCRLTG